MDRQRHGARPGRRPERPGARGAGIVIGPRYPAVRVSAPPGTPVYALIGAVCRALPDDAAAGRFALSAAGVRVPDGGDPLAALIVLARQWVTVTEALREHDVQPGPA